MFGMMIWKRKRVRAERIVVEAYQLVLNRLPDPEGLATHVRALVSGEIDGFELMRSLLTSDEKAASLKRIDQKAVPDVLMDAYLSVLDREPDRAAVEVMTRRVLEENISISQLYGELVSSLEFEMKALSLPFVAGYIQDRVRVATIAAGPSDELAALIEGMITARLSERGCQWSLAPISPNGRSISNKQTAALLRTLAMLGMS